MNTLIKRFNKPSTYLVISDYPEKSSRGEKNYGIAWYTKEFLEPLVKKYGISFVVLAEKGQNDEPELYQNGKILVLRVFDPHHHSLYPIILRWLHLFNKIKFVQVHSEFCANGGIKSQLLIPAFLLLIKLAKRHLTYFSHNVVVNIDNIAPHLNFKKGSFILGIIHFSLKYYYKLLGVLVDQFVVMDEVIFNRLSRFVNKNKIHLIPFWVKKQNSRISQKNAKKILGFNSKEKILLYFGFITYYKGADWIIRTFKDLKQKKELRNMQLVIAGGAAHSLKDKRYYKEYYDHVIESIRDEKRITLTGFIPEEKVSLYFQAADLVLFPYRGLIGGSATLTQTIAFQKLFMISEHMEELLENSDFKKVLEKYNVKNDDLIFKYDHQSFYYALTRIDEQKWKTKVKKILGEIADKRSVTRWVTNCYNELFKNHGYHKKALSKARLIFSN